MPEKIVAKSKEFDTQELLKKAQYGQVNPDIYSNFAQVTMTNNEVILDFYRLLPKPGHPELPNMGHIQRVLLPSNIIPALIGALQTTLDSYNKKDFVIKVLQDDQKKEQS